MHEIVEKQPVYYPELDSLRGLAIVLVVLYHYFPFFQIGWIGVDLFFVLSGFLITTTLIQTTESPHYFKNFFARRVIRIFPLYYLSLIIFFVAAPSLFTNKSIDSAFNYYFTNQMWFWTFTQNWLIIKEGFPPEPYLVHFWSLAVEEQFYLLWPFVISLCRTLNRLKIVAVILFFSALLLRIYLWYTAPENEGYYYNSIARFDSLASGALLSYIIIAKKKINGVWIILASCAFIAMVVGSGIVFNNLNYNSPLLAPIGYSVSALSFMMLCYAGIAGKIYFLHNNVLQFLGRISFGIYVFHLPILLLVGFIIDRWRLFENIFPKLLYIPSVIGIFLTLLISFISYRVLELPLLQLKNKFIN